MLSTFNDPGTSNASIANMTDAGPVEKLCGADFCPVTVNHTYGTKQVDPRIWLLAGILLGFALLASIILILLVDPLSR